MKPRFFTPLLVLTATVIIVTACASPTVEQAIPVQSAPVDELPAQSSQPIMTAWDQAMQVDEQGAVVMEVTPLTLNTQGASLEFEVVLNTHAVDLGMDLAQLATLTTDTGMAVQAAQWDAPRGGHHVSGKLVFPATKDGTPILSGATKISLQIRDVDASVRTFEWELK